MYLVDVMWDVVDGDEMGVVGNGDGEVMVMVMMGW